MKSPNRNIPAPPTNILRDQLKAQRRELITQVMALREQRSALKGTKGTGEQWTLLCEQIDAVQDKIDLISRSLGLPVKERHHSSTPTPNRTNRLFRANRMGRKDAPRSDQYGYGTHQTHHQAVEEVKPDLDAWNRFIEDDVSGNK